jgi:pimeloyl-ACP methyl ester carboxylesterase
VKFEDPGNVPLAASDPDHASGPGTSGPGRAATLAVDPAEEPSPLGVDVPTPAGRIRVHVWPAAEPAHRCVLLACHDWTEDGTVFGPLARALGHRWTVIAPDLPGHGDSPAPPARDQTPGGDGPGTAPVALGDPLPVLTVLDLLPEVAGRRAGVVLLGHGVGALTAARVAAARPGPVRHLVLEDPARATPRRVPSALRRARELHRLRAADPADRIDLTRTGHPGWVEEEYRPWARAASRIDPGHLDAPVDWGEPLLALLADVSCPVTLIRGEPAAGGWMSGTAAHRCTAACRAGAEVVALPAGHHPRRQAREPYLVALAVALGRAEP